MENKILYGVGKVYGETGEIVEFIVVKETPKTYIVKAKTGFYRDWERTVKKSDMSVGSVNPYTLVQSYSDAVELAKAFLHKRIEINNDKVEQIKKANALHFERLKELEAKNEQRT